MLWALQGAIQNDTSTLGKTDWTLDNFCYKPISGEGCIVESAMQYFHDNYTILTELYPSDEDVKTLSTCLTPLPGETRACFDSIGSPVLTFAIFGDTTCQGGEGNDCSQCEVLAGGMQFTFLLQHNEYSLETAEQWEAEVFIRNVKTFNWAMQNDYHTDMTGPVEGMSYNIDLAIQLYDIMQAYYDANCAEDRDCIIPVKADYLAERSIEDNIKLESSQNTSIVVISYLLMFFYVSIAIGFFPNPIHTKFGLGLVGILVVIGSLFAGIGITFYWN